MSSDRLSEIFDVCVTRMAAGASVEQCLRDYPGVADRLRPLLATVTLMRRALPQAREIAAAQDRSRAAMIAAVQSLPTARRRSSVGWTRTLAWVAVLAVMLLGALSLAAESALPGDTLYPVKLVSESARMALTRDPAMAALFAQRRIGEVRAVLADGRQVRVNFAGQVDSVSGSRWQVSGIPVEVSAATEMTEPVSVGDEVIVEGFAASGVVRAGEIERLAPKQPAPTPLFTPTQPLMPTSTPTAQPSRTPPSTLPPSPTPPPMPPTATPEGVCTPTPPDGWVAYALRAGDTTSELAAATSISLDELLAVNCLTMADARSLVVGQTLYLPYIPPTPSPRATAAQPASAASETHHADDSASGSDDHGEDGSSGDGSSGNDDGDSSDDGDSGSGNDDSDNSGHGSDDDDSDSGNDDSDNSGHGSDDGDHDEDD